MHMVYGIYYVPVGYNLSRTERNMIITGCIVALNSFGNSKSGKTLL